jgi:hypothetical protein
VKREWPTTKISQTMEINWQGKGPDRRQMGSFVIE